MSEKYTEEYINEILNESTDKIGIKSAEALNSIHACRINNKLSSGDRAVDFRNAAFIISSYSQLMAIELNKIGIYLIDNKI